MVKVEIGAGNGSGGEVRGGEMSYTA